MIASDLPYTNPHIITDDDLKLAYRLGLLRGTNMMATYRGMKLIIYGFEGLYADCYIEEVGRRHKILISDIEVMGL